MLNAAVTEEQKEEMRRMSPLGCLGRPEDVAELVAFLASDGGGWLTGQNLQVGGGFAMT
jgi:NAD(P)-dependent dehydrogenase (short-subunit alcohol dehydrogenase family)